MADTAWRKVDPDQILNNWGDVVDVRCLCGEEVRIYDDQYENKTACAKCGRQYRIYTIVETCPPLG